MLKTCWQGYQYLQSMQTSSRPSSCLLCQLLQLLSHKSLEKYCGVSFSNFTLAQGNLIVLLLLWKGHGRTQIWQAAVKWTAHALTSAIAMVEFAASMLSFVEISTILKYSMFYSTPSTQCFCFACSNPLTFLSQELQHVSFRFRTLQRFRLLRTFLQVHQHWGILDSPSPCSPSKS